MFWYNHFKKCLNCLEHNLYSTVPLILICRVWVDIILCYLILLDHKLLRVCEGLSYTPYVYSHIDILEVNTRQPNRYCLVLLLYLFHLIPMLQLNLWWLLLQFLCPANELLFKFLCQLVPYDAPWNLDCFPSFLDRLSLAKVITFPWLC